MYVLEMLTKPADAAKLDEDDRAEIQAKHAALREKYEGNKTLIAGAGLTYLGESVSVDSAGVHEGSGELATSREVTAFYVVDCDRATALGIAAEVIDEHVVSVNVREVHHSNGFDRTTAGSIGLGRGEGVTVASSVPRGASGYAFGMDGVPQGYRTLSPYLVVPDAEGLLAFVCDVFETTVRRRTTGEGGGLHAEIELGDSVLMVGEGGDMSFPAMLHVYVADADVVYERALAAGATSAAAPHDTSFGDHRAAFDDRWGNQWWVATRTAASGL